MSLLGTSAAQSTAGLNQAERVEAGDRRRAARPAAKARSRTDEPDQVVVNPDALEAVRNLKDNTQEEAHEDRQGQGQYRPDGTLNPTPRPENLDLEG